jgi:hypothetical protein
MGALDAGPAAAVVLGRHGGRGSAVMGSCPGASGAALATVQGDGVIVYDCEAQVRSHLSSRQHEQHKQHDAAGGFLRLPLAQALHVPRAPNRPSTLTCPAAAAASDPKYETYFPPDPPPALQSRARSWAVGRGHTFAAPAVYDAGCARYFAALAPPGGEDPALVTWTDADAATASLDGMVGGGSTRLPDGLAALVPVGGAVPGNVGVLAVDGGGGVRWFGADARKVAASKDKGSTPNKKPSAGKQAERRVVEAASAVDGGGGVLVVSVGSGGGGRIATLYRAVGGEHSGRSVEEAWSVDVTAPEGAAAARVVAAAAAADELVVLWSGGVWATYAPRAATAGTPTRALTLAGAAGDGAAAAMLVKSGKRSAAAAKAAAAVEVSAAGGLQAAACVPLGGGYYAVAQVGGGCGGARIAVLDAKYGAVHAAVETHPGGGGAAEEGVAISALLDDEVGGGGGSYRIIVAVAGEVVLAEVPAPPPLSLAAALGALSTTGGAVAAAAGLKVLGGDGVAACSRPPHHGVLEPKLPLDGGGGGGGGAVSSGAGVVDLGEPAGIKWWGSGDEKAARDAVALFVGTAPVTAAAALAALKPFLSAGSHQ